MNMHSRIQAEIDLDAMTYNLEHIKKKIKTWNQNHRCLKADGYGHGAVPLKRIQQDPSVWGIAVATVEEGIELGKPELPVPSSFWDILIRRITRKSWIWISDRLFLKSPWHRNCQKQQ